MKVTQVSEIERLVFLEYKFNANVITERDICIQTYLQRQFLN